MVHYRVWSPWLKGLIVLFTLIQVVMFTVRYNITGMRYAQIHRIHVILSLQVGMLVASTIIYKRLAFTPRIKCRQLRDLQQSLLLLFLTLAHSCWFLYYVYLPEQSWLALAAFISVSLYLHLTAFLLAFIVMEWILERVLLPLSPPSSPPANGNNGSNASNGGGMIRAIVKARAHHSAIAVFAAIALTMTGVITTHRDPTIQRAEVWLPSLPPRLDGFSIALLTDMHIGPTVSRARVQQIVDSVNRGFQSSPPDVITIVGDLVDGYLSNLEQRTLPLKELRSRHGIYFSTGNHEYYHDDVDVWLRFFRQRLNMTILRNEHRLLDFAYDEAAGEKGGICLAGVDDLATEHLDVPNHRMDPVSALAGCPSTNHTAVVMLAHQPNAARRIIDSTSQRVDLILSGHTHGGQFYIFYPLAWLRNAFLHGLYVDKVMGTHVYVSSGVNYWGPPVKIWNTCEVVHITLRAGQKGVGTRGQRGRLSDNN